MKTLYVETSVWNRLCDDQIDPRVLWDALAEKQVLPIAGLHDISELAKTFRSGRKTIRAQNLFTYLRGYFDLPIPLIVDNGMLLECEARKATGEICAIGFFVIGESYSEVRTDVDKFCRGEFDSTVAAFIESRIAKAESNRAAIKKLLVDDPSLAASLKSVSAAMLPDYLRSQETGPLAVTRLRAQLGHTLPDKTFEQWRPIAKVLLESKFGIVSRALVRAHFYLAWRCANEQSLPDDVFDDVFHVVNASYCNYFATTDPEQAGYAPLIAPHLSVNLASHDESIFNRLLAGIRFPADAATRVVNI